MHIIAAEATLIAELGLAVTLEATLKEIESSPAIVRLYAEALWTMTVGIIRCGT